MEKDSCLSLSKMDILNSILDNVDQSVIITNPLGEMLFFNKEAAHLSGTLNKKPLQVGVNVLEYVSEERTKVVRTILSEMSSRKRWLNHGLSILN